MRKSLCGWVAGSHACEDCNVHLAGWLAGWLVERLSVLAELALLMVPGSVEAACMSSTSFLKDNLQNRLITHLSQCAHNYRQRTHTLANFPYGEVAGGMG